MSAHSITDTIRQTLTTLYLSNNQIGSQGVQHIANALQTNKVNTSLVNIYILIQPSHQTLMELHLSNNLIDGQGSQYIINALETNKVNTLSVSTHFHKHHTRHSSRLIFDPTVSIMMQKNNWLQPVRRTVH